jgi:hypothetical protein
MDEPTNPPNAALLLAIETVRALLTAFPESLAESQSLDEIDSADLAEFVESLTELRAAENEVYVTVAVAGMILHWASDETGRSSDEILDLIRDA